ncbi:MAG: alpha-amylase [Rhodospirillales bacterium]|nr:alpha-amylase [Rhodospirillales bacterium]
MSDAIWWQRGIVYQIYPRSFQDSDGDGVGDLRGVVRRLDYLVALGVDALWLSPIFPSPMADFGYDVEDYCDVDPLFGDLAAFDRLIGEAHRRGLKVILDLVPNHTSDRHPWFVASRASRDDPRRDWYLWHDPRPDGSPPNNWLSNFGGGGWEWDAATAQYYFHSFLKEQPDLNWRNPAVRQAIYDVLRFWLDRGVDGFRVDVIWLLIKDEQLRDNPVNPSFRPDEASQHRLLPLYTADRPEGQAIVEEMRDVLDAYDERVLIGEIYLPVERLVAYYGKDLRGAHLPFNFQLLSTAWNASGIARIIAEYEAALPPGAWPNWVLGNHDNHRIASRIGAAQAPVAAMLLLTLRGTPTIYYGEEIGMADVAIPPDEVQDPYEKQQPGIGVGRDPERTPMQWDADPNAGFTAGRPWLRLAPDHEARNVAMLAQDPTSILALYRRLIALRRTHPALAVGRLEHVVAVDEILIFERRHGAGHFAILLNFGHEDRVVARPGPEIPAIVLLSTVLDERGDALRPEIALRADEGVILDLTRLPG